MIVVIFEIAPTEGRRDQYLEIAVAMKSLAEQVDGFISVERFQSLMDPSRLLSIPFGEDEKAVAQRRNLEKHRGAQSRGRGGVFADYRLRVAHVIRDYGMFTRDQAPEDSKAAHVG